MKYLNYKKCRLILGCLIGSLALCSSCGNDDEEINEYTANYVYLQKENMAPAVYSLNHNPSGVQGTVEYRFFVKTKKTATADVIVNLDMESADIPVDKIEGARQVTIKAGESQSDIQILKISDWSFAAGAKEAKTYNFQVLVSDIQTKESDLRISTLQGRHILSVTKLEYTPVLSTLPASWTVLSREGWVASASNTYQPKYAPSNAIDGKTDTWFGRFVNKECWLTVTLPNAVTISGFSITRETAYGGYNVKKANIQYKIADSADWQNIDLVYTFSGYSGDDPLYAMLPADISNVVAFKINVLNPTDYAGISEFNLYVKK